jgi:hypothetical protein
MDRREVEVYNTIPAAAASTSSEESMISVQATTAVWTSPRVSSLKRLTVRLWRSTRN